MINTIGIALTGLNSASLRVNASASNIANAFTSGSLEEGGQAPYTPLTTTSAAQEQGGVTTQYTVQTPAFTPAYDPDSPFANEEGYIGVPNVDIAEEAINLKLAEISYKANISVVKTAESMFDALLDSVDKKA